MMDLSASSSRFNEYTGSKIIKLWIGITAFLCSPMILATFF